MTKQLHKKFPDEQVKSLFLIYPFAPDMPWIWGMTMYSDYLEVLSI